jgi:hypothetical protein
MKIEIELYGEKFTWESESHDYDIYTVVDKIRGLLVASGYHPENIDKIFDSNAIEPYLINNESDEDDFEYTESVEDYDDIEDDIFSVDSSAKSVTKKDLI